MRFFIFIATLLFAVSAVSAAAARAEAVQLSCVTQFPTTSYFVAPAGDRIKSRILHHNGTKFMPIHTGIIVPNDLPILDAKAQIMQKLGRDMVFEWPAAGCQKLGGLRFSCYGGIAKNVNGLAVEPSAIYVSKVTEEGTVGTYEKYVVNLSLNIEGQNYHTSMDYAGSECTDE